MFLVELLSMSSVESTHDTLRPEHDKSPAKEFGSYYALAKELASSDPNQAITYYRKALAIDAGDPWVHYDLGILLLEQTHLEAAQKEFLEVTVLEPTYHWTYQHLGDIAVQHKQSDVAQKYYLNAIELAEQNHATGDCLWTYYKLAKELEDSDVSQAINYYQKALTLNKGYPWIHYDFGVFLAKQNHLARAQEEFLKVAELEPNYYGTYQHLGDIAFQQNQSEDAEAFYLKGIELAEQHDSQADCFWIYYKLAKEVEGLNAEGSRKYYQKALDINAGYPWIHYDFGVFLAKQGNLEVARQAFSQVVELESNCYWAYYYLGDLAFQAKQWREAATFYMKAAELALEDKANQDSKFAVNNYFEAVRNLRLLDDLDGAKRVCQKILTLDSEHYQTYCELADILKYQGRLKQACEVYKNLLAIKQDFVWGHNLLGDTLTQLKQIQEARLCYKSALRYEILESKPYLHASVDGFLGKPAKPQFMVIGFAKCGTTSLYRYLVKHPKILPTAKKEIMFFSENYDK
ncbi:MAG: tetratricopeptide repeat protein, partial [Cyanobacteria bacterium P01_F01_bin.86]